MVWTTFVKCYDLQTHVLLLENQMFLNYYYLKKKKKSENVFLNQSLLIRSTKELQRLLRFMNAW